MTRSAYGLPETLTTTRLTLVTPATGHVPAIARLANNSAVHANMSRLPFPYQESDAVFFVDQIARGRGEWNWAIEHDGEFIGMIGLSLDEGQLPVLGFWLGQPFWGQGFATEAGHAVVASARDIAIAPGLSSRALKTNLGSLAVQAKLGFRVIGEAPEHAESNIAGQLMVLTQLDFAP